jgi:hypothetical protein
VRRALAAVLLAVATAHCNAIVGFGNLTKQPTRDAGTSGDDDTSDDDDDHHDAGGSANGGDGGGTTAACNPNADSGAAVALPGPVNSTSFENSPSLTDDELTIVFQRTVDNNVSNLMMATRATTNDAFGDPAVLPLTTSNLSFMPSITRDGLTLFWSEVADTNRGMDVFIATRPTVGTAQFTNPISTGIASNVEEQDPIVTGDGNEMFFASDLANPGGDKRQLFRANRDNLGEFKNPQAVTELNSDGTEQGVAVSRDGLTIFFGSTRTGGAGKLDVWTAHRSSRSEKFGAATVLTAVNSPLIDWPTFISADGCRLYLGSERGGAGDLYVATKPH